MVFTAIHHALGLPSGAIDEDLIDSAIAAGVSEGAQLDWKTELPPFKGLVLTDFPKDIAAMANSGGGVIVYGVRERQKRATERCGGVIVDEASERTIRQAAIQGITPPVFDIEVHRVGDEEYGVVAVEVRASVDSPHLIYRNGNFAVPVRNDADTIWASERSIEQMYRTRLEERRRVAQSLHEAYDEAVRSVPPGDRYWFVGVARPRTPHRIDRLSEEDARNIFRLSAERALAYAKHPPMHPLDRVDRIEVRPGLRRWVAPSAASSVGRPSPREAWVSLHDDGSVTVVASVGGTARLRSKAASPVNSNVESVVLECAIADVMALVKEIASSTAIPEFDVCVGVTWSVDAPLQILGRDRIGRPDDSTSTPLHAFVPVSLSVDASSADADFAARIRELAQDLVNQGGVSALYALRR